MGIDYFDGEHGKPQENTLERISTLAHRARRLEEEVSAATVALAEKQGELDRILMNHIPEIMNELGMEAIKLTDGSTVTVKNDVKASIPVESRAVAFLWLEKNNYDGIIKTKVIAAFGKGETEDAKKAQQAIAALGYDVDLDRSVHPATLKSFVNERLAAGESLPSDGFSIFEFKKAVIKLPKK